MSLIQKNKLKLKLRKEDISTSGSPGGLARTHKIIRTQQLMELQFALLCKQITKNENKEKRSENQRNDRKVKRNKAQL